MQFSLLLLIENILKRLTRPCLAPSVQKYLQNSLSENSESARNSVKAIQVAGRIYEKLSEIMPMDDLKSPPKKRKTPSPLAVATSSR